MSILKSLLRESPDGALICLKSFLNPFRSVTMSTEDQSILSSSLVPDWESTSWAARTSGKKVTVLVYEVVAVVDCNGYWGGFSAHTLSEPG